MSKPETSELPDLQQLVLAYARPADRGAWHAFFALDTQLASLVRKATEPLLGQVRLAWWRDRLQEDVEIWPRGNPVLSSIANSWASYAAGLAPLVDGWEHLLAEPPIGPSDIEGFAAGRGQALAALSEVAGADEYREAALLAGTRWALADLAANSTAEDEQAAILNAASHYGLEPVRLSRAMRPLAILDGLAIRSIRAQGAPLFAGRRAALAALRLGMFGR